MAPEPGLSALPSFWLARPRTDEHIGHAHPDGSFVSATRTPSCKDSRRNAMLRHDQALKKDLDEVAKAGLRAGT